MTTFSQLKMDIESWSLSQDQSAKTTTFITLAEERHRWGQVTSDGKRSPEQGAIRVRAMEKRATISGTGTDSLPLPDDFLEHRWLHFTGATLRDRELKFVGTEHLVFNTNWQPTRYTITREELLFDGAVTSDMTVEMVYYESFTPLSDVNTTNWLSLNAYGCYLWAAIAEAQAFLQDVEAAAFAEGKYAQAVSALMASESRARYSRGSKRVSMGNRSVP